MTVASSTLAEGARKIVVAVAQWLELWPVKPATWVQFPSATLYPELVEGQFPTLLREIFDLEVDVRIYFVIIYLRSKNEKKNSY